MLLSFDEVCAAVQGARVCDARGARGFDGVSFDSRAVVPRDLFIPLRGAHVDGHTFVEEALQKGAVATLIDQRYPHAGEYVAWCTRFGAACIAVHDTLRALQDLASFYCKKFPALIRIGITGSSGKTTVKEMARAVFSERYRVVATPGNLNSEIGLPQSLFFVRAEHEVGIFELGMNRRGEMRTLAQILVPHYAIITNVGCAHVGILGTQQAIAEEKKEIFSQFTEHSVGFVPDDAYRVFLSNIPYGRVVVYDQGGRGLATEVIDEGLRGSRVLYQGRWIRVPLPGVHNAKNALAVIALAAQVGLPAEEIQRGMERVKPPFGRSHVVCASLTFLLDCYNANPDSMAAALHLCAHISAVSKVYVLGDMGELGVTAAEAHYRVCVLAAASDARAVYVFGPEFSRAVRKVSWGRKRVYAFALEELSALQETLDAQLRRGDFVLVKGSRSVALERLEPLLRKER